MRHSVGQKPVTAENPDEFLQLFRAARFGQERIRAECVGPVDFAQIMMRREDHHAQPRLSRLLANPLQHLDALAPGQPEIQQDKTGQRLLGR